MQLGLSIYCKLQVHSCSCLCGSQSQCDWALKIQWFQKRGGFMASQGTSFNLGGYSPISFISAESTNPHPKCTPIVPSLFQAVLRELCSHGLLADPPEPGLSQLKTALSGTQSYSPTPAALLPWTLYPGQGSVALTSGLPGSIHGDLDGSVVGGHLGRVGEHGDCERETFPWGNQGRSLRPDTFAAPQPPTCILLPQSLTLNTKRGKGEQSSSCGPGISGLRKYGSRVLAYPALLASLPSV